MPRLSADFSATEPGSVSDYTIDFIGNIPANASLTNATWSLSVQRTLPGFTADANPMSRLVGSPATQGDTTIQRIGGLLAGNDYVVAATGTMSDGEAVVLWCLLPCRAAGEAPAPSANAVDWTDPCARAAALRNAYYALLGGQQEIEIRTRTLDAEETVRFAPTDLGKLEAELRGAEGECALATGSVNLHRRFAITAGSRRKWPWYGCR
jgi:hypothetical protein